MSKSKLGALLAAFTVFGNAWAMNPVWQLQTVDPGRVTIDHGDNPNGWGGIDSIQKNVPDPRVMSRISTPPPSGGATGRSAKP